MANNRFRVRGLESASPGANPAMWYITPSGVWAPVSGAFGTDLIPKGTVTPDVAWSADATSGGGGGDTSFGPTGPRTTPPSTGWSWFNQRGSTEAISSRDGSIHLHVPVGAAGASTVTSARMRTPALATPYTVIANLSAIQMAADFMHWGLCFGNAGAEITLLYYGYVSGTTNIYIAPTSGGSAGTARFGAFTVKEPINFMALRDDGTNKKYYIGVQEEHMMEIYSEARATQFTPTQIGWIGSPRNNSYPVDVTLWSWKEQSAAPITT